MAFDLCCLWGHFEKDLRERLGVKYARAESAFLKGQYDKELLEKLKTQSSDFNIEELRLIQVLDGTSTSVKSLATQEEEATMSMEQAKLKKMVVSLAKEVKQFELFQESMSTWQNRSSADARAFLVNEARMMTEAAEKCLQTWAPVVRISRKEYIATEVQKQLTAFAQMNGVDDT